MSIPSIRSVLMILAMVVVAVLLAGCEAKITQENYDKITTGTTGMSRSEVERLLGGPGASETGSGTSITGAGIGDSRAAKMEVFRWKDGSKHIVITFKDGKAFEKTQQGLQ